MHLLPVASELARTAARQGAAADPQQHGGIDVGGSLMFVTGFIGSTCRQDVSTMFERNPIRYMIMIAGVVAVAALAFINALFPSGPRYVLAVALCLAQAAVLFMYAAFDANLPVPDERSSDEVDVE